MNEDRLEIDDAPTRGTQFDSAVTFNQVQSVSTEPKSEDAIRLVLAAFW